MGPLSISSSRSSTSLAFVSVSSVPVKQPQPASNTRVSMIHRTPEEASNTISPHGGEAVRHQNISLSYGCTGDFLTVMAGKSQLDCQFLTENQYPISTAAALHGRMQESLISYICELSAVTRQKCLLCNQCVITSTLQVGSDWLALPPEPTVGCEFTGQINILLVNMQTVPPYMGCH